VRARPLPCDWGGVWSANPPQPSWRVLQRSHGTPLTDEGDPASWKDQEIPPRGDKRSPQGQGKFTDANLTRFRDSKVSPIFTGNLTNDGSPMGQQALLGRGRKSERSSSERPINFQNFWSSHTLNYEDRVVVTQGVIGP